MPERGGEFWTVELFLEELDNLLATLGIAGDYFLLGQSWGGMLAAEHAVHQPPGLRGLVISNSPASMQLWRSEAARLRTLLPATVAEALDRHEANATMSDPQYLAAEQAYYDEYVCRVLPNPPELLATKAFMEEDSTVYHVMNGPNEFFCVGTLREWTIVDRLHSINVPTLLLSGRYDEATPATVEPYFEHISDVRWEVFEASSHMPFFEERERYMRVLTAFLGQHDRCSATHES
jgi:L-proline amide hydrolase